MESGNTGIADADVRAGNVTSDDESTPLSVEPGIEQYITSDVVLSLLGIPETGLLRISAALLIAGNNELCAYWWRDAYSGQQHAEFRDPVLVCSAFSRASIDSGYLPPGVVRMGLSGNVTWMTVYVPPASYQLVLQGENEQTTTIRLGLPGLLVTGYGTQYWMWAVKDRTISAHTLLYHVPLSNIGGDGRLCFGSNSVPEVSGATILRAFHLFFESPFNDHWATSKSTTHLGDIREHLRELSASASDAVFPEDELLPITAKDTPAVGLTLDQVLRHVLQVMKGAYA